jgi:hypothetical protein
MRLPGSSPTEHRDATQADIVEKILWLRQQYHFGPAKIAMHLERYHDVKVSASGVWRILRKVGLNRLPASQRYKRRSTHWKRYEKQRPGHQLQVDVKFIEPLGQRGRKKRYHQYTAHRRLHPAPRPARLPAQRPEDRDPVHRPRTGQAAVCHRAGPDRQHNGQEFGAAFHWHLLDKGIGHVHVKPRTPRLNGKVERSHRIDSEEFYRLLEGQVVGDVHIFTPSPRSGTTTIAPHGALAGQTPYE